MLDLDLDDQQDQLVRAVSAYCTGRVPPAPTSQTSGPRPFPAALWQGLVELGVIGLAHPASGAGRLDLVAAMEALGAVAAPGPLVAAHVASATLPTEMADGVADGSLVPSLGADGWFPWALDAQVLLELDRTGTWLVKGDVHTSVDSLAREPLARVDTRRVEAVGTNGEGLIVGQLALAAYLSGAALAVLDLAASHALGRRQFGRPIGDFQAVSHPLARAYTKVIGARNLGRVAAHRADAGGHVQGVAAATRLAASDAALEATHVAHQVLGAVGFTEEAPLATFTRQIRQWVGHAPGVALARDVVTELGTPPAGTSTEPARWSVLS